MPAYVIVDIDVTDPERYEQYKAATPATLAAADGRFPCPRRGDHHTRGRLAAIASGGARIRKPRGRGALL